MATLNTTPLCACFFLIANYFCCLFSSNLTILIILSRMGDWVWPFEVQTGTPSLITLSQRQIIITDLCGYAGCNHRFSLNIQSWSSGRWDSFKFTIKIISLVGSVPLHKWPALVSWQGSWFLFPKNNPVERHSLSINVFNGARQN